MKIPATHAQTRAQAKRGSLQHYPDRDENGRGGGVIKRSSSSDPDGRGHWSMTVVMQHAMTAPNQGRPPPGNEIVTPGACTAEEKKTNPRYLGSGYHVRNNG
jgi:hypothetical protein